MSITKIQRTLDSLFANLPESPASAEKQLAEIAVKFRQTMTKFVTPRINSFIAASNATCLAEFQSAATHVNHVLSMTGQCVVVDGKPALLTAEPRDYYRKDGHFVLVVRQSQFVVDRVVLDSRNPQITLAPLNEAFMDSINQLYRTDRGSRML